MNDEAASLWTPAELKLVNEELGVCASFIAAGDIAGMRPSLRALMLSEHADLVWLVLYRLLSSSYNRAARNEMRELFEELEREWEAEDGKPYLRGSCRIRPLARQLTFGL